MFFRTKRTKTGSALQLVHNYRNNEGSPRQKVVVSLGHMCVPVKYRKEIAEEVKNRLDGQETLFPLSPCVAKWTDKIVGKISGEKRWTPRFRITDVSEDEEVVDGVLVDRIEHENETELGSLLVLGKAWNELGIGNCLSAAGLSKRQINAAMVSVFNRLIEPVSENELSRWVETMGFNDLFGEDINNYGKDSYYRVSDLLLLNSQSIEKHLRDREQSLFNLDRSIILYDLTNTYFEGKCGKNSKAARGHSKEKRSDCPLLSLGITVDSEGFMLTHQIFEGNRQDSRTLIKMVEQLEKLYPGKKGGDSRHTVIVDGGIATEKNLKHLVDNGYEYIVAGKRQSRNKFYEDFCDEDSFSIVQGRVGKPDVHISRKEHDGELKILCRSEQRKEKENAILSRVEEKYIDELEHLNSRLGNPKSHLKTDSDVERAIGKINSKYSRASKFYEVVFHRTERIVSWKRSDEKYSEAVELHGCYFLRSSMTDLSGEKIWLSYSRLTKVEHAFEMMKTFLGIRPVRHHTEERCDAHIFITAIAYHMMHWIETTMKFAGSPSTWWNLRRLLQTHCYSTIIVPSKDGRIRHIRKAGKPDERQRSIYELFKIDCRQLPKIKKISQPM